MYQFTATYDETWFDDTCDNCGKVVEVGAWGAEHDYKRGGACQDCGFIGEAYTMAEDPCEVHGWADPANPADSWHFGQEPMTYVIDTMQEAVQFVQDFAFDVWDFTDGSDSEQDVRTGHYFRYYLHAPAVVLAVCADLEG